ncbi:MAG: helix-turn-helix transcriptional regulator [Clostridiaceae bacterium]
MLKNKELASYIEANLTKATIAGEIAKAEIASEIMKSRLKKGMNQKEFAQYMNVSQAMISKWESGECNFSISTICEICDKLSLVFSIEITAIEQYCITKTSDEWSGIGGSNNITDMMEVSERSKDLVEAA